MLSFYLGIYVQRYGKTDNGGGEYLKGDGYCDGWAEYLIKKIQAKPMIPPVLSNGKVQLPVGKIYNTYTYTVTYSDENNDKPKKITLTIDNKIGPEPMKKQDETDNNYQDGCVYKYVINGNEFDPGREEHDFVIFAEDIEVKANRLSGIGPIITENILPAVRPSSSNQYLIYEDDPISYLDLNATFEDPDNDTLYFRLSDGKQEWANVYNSNNISVKVIKNTDDQGNVKKFLEFKLKKNKYNRLRGQKFGSEIVYLNVSDEDPSKDGGITRAHYLWNPYELELIIIEVNDPPEIKSPFSYHSELVKGEMILDEDQHFIGFDLKTVFWDPVENNPLTYSVRNNNNIEVRFYKNITGEYMDIIPNENWTGTESIEIIADDGEAWVADALKVKITPVNDNPFLNYTPKQVIYEDKWYNITFIGNDLADNEQVYFETNLFDVLELADNEYKFNSETGELRFKPNNNNVGTHKNIWIKVRDYHDGETMQYVIFEIKNSPDSPEPTILNPSDNSRFLDYELIDFQGTFYDPDDEVLLESHNFYWHSSIDGLLSMNENFRSSLTEGEHIITLTIIDSIKNGSVSIRLKVVGESNEDKDDDDIPDYWEILHFLNDNNPHDADEDPDVDTFSNLEEYLGEDGKSGGNDDTDPYDQDSHPSKHFIKPLEKETTTIYGWIGLVIVIFIILIITYIFITKKRSLQIGAKETSELPKPQEQKIWRDMFGRRYEVYSYEPVEIVCHNCLTKQDIQIPIRPLVITCSKCKTRGVLYK
jgi:hypothetical protein